MHYEVYKDTKDDWRWRLKAENGRIVADCAEGYKNKQDMLDEIDNIQIFNIRDLKIVGLESESKA